MSEPNFISDTNYPGSLLRERLIPEVNKVYFLKTEIIIPKVILSFTFEKRLILKVILRSLLRCTNIKNDFYVHFRETLILIVIYVHFRERLIQSDF